MLRLACAIAAPIAALTLAACGGDDALDADLASLGARAQPPADVTGPSVAAVDFTAVREQLGLPDDASFEPDRDHGQESLVFSATGAYVIPFVRTFVSQLRPTPLFEAFDGGAITAAAGSSTPGGTTVLATTQPFDEIADSLRDAGYEEADGVLTAPEDGEDGVAWSVADAGDGVVVLAETPEAARAAADGEGDDTRREAFDAVDQAVRFAFVGDPDDEADCTLRFVAVGQDARPPDGEIVVMPVDGDEVRESFEDDENARPGAGPGFLDAVRGRTEGETVCPST